jgi:hypothetical protein
MYHPSVAWVPKDVRLLEFSWTTIRVPGGARGVVLKSKIPWMAA